MTTLTSAQYNKLQKNREQSLQNGLELEREYPPQIPKVLQAIKAQWDSFCTGLGIYNEYNDEAQYIAPNGEKRSYTFHDACC